MSGFDRDRPRVALCLLAVIALAGVTSSAAAQDIPRLRARLAKQPEDVDARLRLASKLSWEGKLAEAKQQVERVIAQTPKYWDAHLLLARINGWQKRYVRALEQVNLVLRHQPGYRPAVFLKLDLLVWSGRGAEADKLIGKLMAKRETADLHHRLAQLDRQRLRFLSAYRRAKRALAIDPLYKPALRVIRDTRFLQFNFSYEFEHFPIEPGVADAPDMAFGHGLIVSAMAMPRNWINITLSNTFRRRFGTFNNQVFAMVNWRLNRRWELFAGGGVGLPANVVARGSGSFAVRHEVYKWLDASVSYAIDRLAWPATLHRVTLESGVKLPLGLHAGVLGRIGALDYCDRSPVLWGFSLSARWIPKRINWRAGVHYGYGMELNKPDATRLPLDQCPPITFIELKSHTIGGQVGYKLSAQLSLRTGYTIQIRSDSRLNHLTNLSGLFWF